MQSLPHPLPYQLCGSTHNCVCVCVCVCVREREKEVRRLRKDCRRVRSHQRSCSVESSVYGSFSPRGVPHLLQTKHSGWYMRVIPTVWGERQHYMRECDHVTSRQPLQTTTAADGFRVGITLAHRAVKFLVKTVLVTSIWYDITKRIMLHCSTTQGAI